MKIHHNSLKVLKEAIKQQRQLTLAERAQASEVFAALRARIGVRVPDKRPVLADFTDEDGVLHPKDSPEVARLKLRGLYEIAKHARDNPDDESDFLLALFHEAAFDFAVNPNRHKKGVPPQIAAARAARAALAGDALVDARLSEMESRLARTEAAQGEHAENFARNTIATDDYAQGLEERIATLEQGAAFVAKRMDALDNALKALEDARKTDNTQKGSDA